MSDDAGWRRGSGPLASWTLGEGPRCALIHGFTQGHGSWQPIGQFLAERGRQVVVVDLPGHGGSSTIRADLRRTADLLAQTVGEADVVGYSLGGRVALHLALMYPHLVSTLALLGANPGIAEEEDRITRRAADDALATRLVEIGLEAFLAEWVTQPLFAGLVITEEDRTERLTNTVEGLTSSLRLCGTGAQSPLWPRLLELAMPVLYVAGEADAAYREIGRRLVAAVPDGRLELISEAGHAVHLQAPEHTAVLLDSWLPHTA